MRKLPISVSQGRALVATAATVLGPKVVEFLKDPARADQLRSLVEWLGPALRARTPERRLDAKIDALRAQLEAVQPGDPAHEKLESWRRRLGALDAKRALVASAWSGRERTKQLKVVSRQVDDLLLEFLELSDATIRGES